MILATSALVGIGGIALGGAAIILGLFYTEGMHSTEGEADTQYNAIGQLLRVMPMPVARGFYVLVGAFFICGGILILT